MPTNLKLRDKVKMMMFSPTRPNTLPMESGPNTNETTIPNYYKLASGQHGKGIRT